MKKVHFIGIGGIGVSAIARMMILEGAEVTGSDQSHSPVTDELIKLGARINFEHKKENVEAGTTLVVHTIAIPADNPELVEAKKEGIKCQTYPETLGELSREKFTIAVSGTHGKTTTTAMIAQILIEAGLDPTVIIGSFLLREDGTRTNFIAGKSDPARLNGRSVGYLVVEACEYKRSFLNLSPKILVITNIDADHLDYYKDLTDIKLAFAEISAKSEKVITENEYQKMSTDFKLRVPGAHNVRNAQAALAVAEALGIRAEVAVGALNKFRGAWRRFEYKGEFNGAIVYEDYAHHPTEIRATIQGVRELYPNKRLVIFFQPHLYSRTKQLLADFAQALALADLVLVAPIYAAREASDPSINHQILASEVNKVKSVARAVSDFAEAEKSLRLELSEGDLLMTMGAGEAYKVGENLLTK